MDFRIAICAAGEIFGGVERHILDLTSYLQHNGVKSYLFLYHDSVLAQKARDNGIKTLIIPARNSYEITSIRKLAHELVDREINVVHAHGYRSMVNCALARKFHDFAIVKTEHGRMEPVGFKPVMWFKNMVYGSLDKIATCRAANAICYVTEDMRCTMNGVHHGVRKYTIPNGIDPIVRDDLIRPEEYTPDLYHLGIIGRISRVKGIQHALSALNSEDIPEHVRLNIIGRGPMENELLVKCEQLGLQDRVRFLGFKSNVYDYIAHCDALLIPSLHEGLPYILLEAMSLGIPILASRTGGLAEVLTDGETALMFEPKNVLEMRNAICKFVHDSAYARSLGEAAGEYQRKRYTLSGMGENYIKVYDSVMVGEDG